MQPLDPKKRYYAIILSERSTRALQSTLAAMRQFTELPAEAFLNLDREFIKKMATIRADIDDLVAECKDTMSRVEFGIGALGPSDDDDNKIH